MMNNEFFKSGGKNCRRELSAACLHDISCLGRCSLTAALPVISAARISVGVLPTALLSTQTGGLNQYTYLDLTDEMKKIMSHWKKLGVTFDAVYSGFLGSAEQIEIVENFLENFMRDGGIYLCDPAMADNGELYNTFDGSFVAEMSELVKFASVITPNVTEAFFLLGREYKKGPYDKSFADELVSSLSEKYKVKYTMITGVSLEEEKTGVIWRDYDTKEISFLSADKIKGNFFSTGDLFASALTGGLLRGLDLNDAVEISEKFVSSAIKNTVKNGGDSRFGLDFEPCLQDFINQIDYYLRKENKDE